MRSYLTAALGAALMVTAYGGSAAADTAEPAFAPEAAQQWGRLDGTLRQDWSQSGTISAGQAKNIAQARVPSGKFLDIRRVGNTYRVRFLMPDGRRIDIRVDAQTGAVRG